MSKILRKAVFNAAAIGSGESASSTAKTRDPEQGKLKGAYYRDSSSYDVDLKWMDDAGNVIITESLASGQTSTGSGNVQTCDTAARSNYVEIVISDEDSTGSAGSGAAYGIFHIY